MFRQKAIGFRRAKANRTSMFVQMFLSAHLRVPFFRNDVVFPTPAPANAGTHITKFSANDAVFWKVNLRSGH